MQVAGSASGTHKHDGDNTTECLQIKFVDVEFAQSIEVIFTSQINIELPR
jgi:hypothetical protein